LPRPRLVLVPALVLAALLAMGGGRALAQSDEPDPSKPKFEFDRDTAFFDRMTKALGELADALGTVAGGRIAEATDHVNALIQELDGDPYEQRVDDSQLLESVVVPDKATLDDLEARAAETTREREAARDRQDQQAPVIQDGLTAYAVATDKLARRLLDAARKNAAKQGLVDEPPPSTDPDQAPTDETVQLRDYVHLHLADADPSRRVWQSSEEAAYWAEVLERTDLTESQRETAEQRADRAEVALDRAKETAARDGLSPEQIGRLELDGGNQGVIAASTEEPTDARPEPPRRGELKRIADGKPDPARDREDPRRDVWVAAARHGYWWHLGRQPEADQALAELDEASRQAKEAGLDPDQIDNLEADGGAYGEASAGSGEPLPNRDDSPADGDLADIAGEGEPRPEDQPTKHADSGAQAHLGEEFTETGEAPALPEVIATPELPGKVTLPEVTRPGTLPADSSDGGENVEAEQADTNVHQGDDWKWTTGGKVEPFELKAGSGTNGGTNGGATDWFSGSEVLPPGVDCGGQVFKGAFVNCPGKVPEPPPGHVTPLPGLELGSEEGGCDKIELAAFSDCGLGEIDKPNIFVPDGDLDPPGPTGCGPVGVIAICTGTSGELGGTRDTATDLDRLFHQSGDPFQLDPGPVVPVVPVIPVPPGSSADLAA
jgi:hypothetical protein